MRALVVLRERGEAIRARVQGEVGGILRDASPEALADAAARAGEALDEAGRDALARSQPPGPACAAGCAHCCHVHAYATVPEILAVARHLARTRSPEDLARIRAHLAAQADRVEHLDDEARWGARIPCALLDGAGRCSIHPARPLRCRAFHSCDVDPCRAAFEGQPGTEPVRIPRLDRASDAAEAGYDAALVEAGLSAEGYRLEIGLLVALEDPGAGERWRAGEPAFARARGR